MLRYCDISIWDMRVWFVGFVIPMNDMFSLSTDNFTKSAARAERGKGIGA
jgi:hypothetical protein